MRDAQSAAAGPVRDVDPYSRLAAGYDVVMEHVDYDGWARYAHGLLRRHAPAARTVLELGCGTGSLATALQPMGPYEYLATDRSPEMLAVAEAKADFEGADVAFAVADFLDFRTDPPVDAVLLLYDGINYVLEPEGIAAVFRGVHRSLKEGGVFVFDLSTPANSENNADWFEDEGSADGFSYRRTSAYDPESRLHVTTIDMTVEGESFREEHRERAYTVDEIRPLVEACGFRVEAMLDGFGSREADSRSERVHWVARRIPDVGATDSFATFPPNSAPPPS
jgi:SAM-dependent methyltransferase